MFLRAATEAEWADCQEPRRMIKVVQNRGSERKQRLAIVAAARLFWDQLPVGEMREAVEACEGRADGVVGQETLDDYRRRFYGYVLRDAPPGQRQWDENPALRSAFGLVLATTCPGSTLRTLAGNKHWRTGAEPRDEQVSDIIRDIFGNPFRPVRLDASWRTSTAVALASRMYDSRDFSAMPILADALQDAGCENADVLAHCYSEGPHVRGCWVVDLVLGKG
jgi:hypothetical protein